MPTPLTVENLCPYMDNRAYNGLVSHNFVFLGDVEEWIDSLCDEYGTCMHPHKKKGIGKRSVASIRNALVLFREQLSKS